MGRCGFAAGEGITGFSLSDTAVLLLSRCFLLMGRSGRLGCRRDALATSAPINDFGFVDLVAPRIGGREAGGVTDRTIDVDHLIARPTDEVVVIVTNPVLVPGRRPGGLDSPQEALLGERGQCVVHRLP